MLIDEPCRVQISRSDPDTGLWSQSGVWRRMLFGVTRRHGGGRWSCWHYWTWKEMTVYSCARMHAHTHICIYRMNTDHIWWKCFQIPTHDSENWGFCTLGQYHRKHLTGWQDSIIGLVRKWHSSTFMSLLNLLFSKLASQAAARDIEGLVSHNSSLSCLGHKQTLR